MPCSLSIKDAGGPYYLEGLDVRESLFVADVRCDDFDLLFREFVQHFRVSIRYSDVGLGKVKGFV